VIGAIFMKFGRAPTTRRILGRSGDGARCIGKTRNSGKALDRWRDLIPPAATGANLSQGGEVANGRSVASRGAFGKRALPEAIGIRAGLRNGCGHGRRAPRRRAGAAARRRCPRRGESGGARCRRTRVVDPGGDRPGLAHPPVARSTPGSSSQVRARSSRRRVRRRAPDGPARLAWARGPCARSLAAALGPTIDAGRRAPRHASPGAPAGCQLWLIQADGGDAKAP
jgi:hypothetical protein